MPKVKVITRQYPYIFSKLKPIIIFIYNSNCQLCSSERNKLEVHHIDKNINNNSPFNLIPLCKSCHKLVHIVANPNFQIQIKKVDHKLKKLSLLLPFFS